MAGNQLIQEGAQEPPAKRSKVGNEGTGSHVRVDTAPRRMLRTVSHTPLHIGNNVTHFVPTLRAVNGDGQVVPPDGWEADDRYASRWDSPFGEAIDPEEYNNRITEVKDVAWLLAGIRSAKLAVKGSQVLELLNLTWKPCWVPLNLVELDSERLTGQLEAERRKYEASPFRTKMQHRRTIPPLVLRVLSLYHLTQNSKFLLRSIFKFSVVTSPELGDNVEVIKCDFRATFEHSSALFMNQEMWKRLCEVRIEAASRFLRDLGDSEEMKTFKAKANENLCLFLRS